MATSSSPIRVKHTLYSPGIVAPVSITDADYPGNLCVTIFRSSKEPPEKPVFYYRFGSFIETNSAKLAYLDECSLFRQLKDGGHTPTVTRLNYYRTTKLRLLKFHLNYNLLARNFQRLAKKKVTLSQAHLTGRRHFARLARLPTRTGTPFLKSRAMP